MTRRRRILLAILFALWVGMVLACTGAADRKEGGSEPKPDGVAIVQTSKESGTDAAEKAAARAKARAQAEAEAETKNEANCKAYDAEVQRAKAAYEKKLEKFRANKEAFEKAMPIYQAARAEVEATKNLNIARTFNNAKEKKIARRRFREIIDQYPTTQAAKDAKILLDDGYVSARATPAEPIEPVLPVEPRLVLPAPPEPVAVIYPREPEELVAAQAIADKDFLEVKGGDYQTPVRHANGKTVYVRGHFRSNGTYVPPHMRAAPGSGTGGRRK
jgi:hypothetical protein